MLRLARRGLLAAALLACAAGAGAMPAAAARPNVVVLMTDDQCVADLAAMPNTRKLIGRDGVTFTNSFVPYSLCCPSRATYITGQHAHNHGVRSNFAPEGAYYALKNRANVLPTWLRRSGYRTAHVGKFLNHFGNNGDRAEIPPGWDDWRGTVDLSTYDYFNWMLNKNGKLKSYGDPAYVDALVTLGEDTFRNDTFRTAVASLRRNFRPGWFGTEDPKNYSTDVLTSEAVDVIRGQRRSHKPLFLSLAPVAPHREDVNGLRANLRLTTGEPELDPRPAPRDAAKFRGAKARRTPAFNNVAGKPELIRALPPLTAADEREMDTQQEGRLGSLVAVDRMVGRVVRELKRTGRYRNTIFVFTSDNGWVAGDYRIIGNKFLPYENSIRVPLLMRGPGIPRGKKVSTPVMNIDLAPTILDAANARAGRRMDGVSLLPVVRRPSRAPRRAVPLEALSTLLPSDFPILKYGQPYIGVRTPRYTFVRWKSGEEELYDVTRDRHQLSNLAADPAFAARKAQLARLAEKLSRCRGAKECSATS
jgi:arylsulfatase A-like enzyme